MRYDSDSHEGSTRPVRCVWNGGATEREFLFNVCRLVFFLLDPVPASGTRRRGPLGRIRSGPGEGRLPAPEVSGCPADITGRRRAPPCAGVEGGRLCPAGAAASPAPEVREEDGRYGEGAWATIGKKQVLDNGPLSEEKSCSYIRRHDCRKKSSDRLHRLAGWKIERRRTRRRCNEHTHPA